MRCEDRIDGPAAEQFSRQSITRERNRVNGVERKPVADIELRVSPVEVWLEVVQQSGIEITIVDGGIRRADIAEGRAAVIDRVGPRIIDSHAQTGHVDVLQSIFYVQRMVIRKAEISAHVRCGVLSRAQAGGASPRVADGRSRRSAWVHCRSLAS